MSFDNLQSEILEEFAGHAGALDFTERNGFGFRQSPEEARVAIAQWRQENAGLISSKEYRARAIIKAREWRAKVYADPVLLAAFRARRYAAQAKYVEANREAVNRYARERARRIRAAAPKQLKQQKNVHTRRDIRFLAWVTSQPGEIQATDVMRELGMSRDMAGVSLRRRMAEGLLERVRFGVYRVVSK